MTAWTMLFSKEFRASRVWCILNLLLILMGAGGFFLLDPSKAVIYSLLVMIILHIIYLPLWVIFSVFLEWKDRTLAHWVNLPHSGAVLLTAKYAAGIMLMTASLLISSGVLALLYQVVLDTTASELAAQASSWFMNYFWAILFGTMIMAVFSGTQVVCAIVIAKSVTRFKLLSVIVFLLLPSLFQVFFNGSENYTRLVSWGLITSASEDWLQPLLMNEYEVIQATNVLSELTIYSLGLMLFQLVYVLLLLWISSRLLDKAVQI